MLRIKINDTGIVREFSEKYHNGIIEKLNNIVNSGFKYKNESISLNKNEKKLLKKYFLNENNIRGIIEANPKRLRAIIRLVNIKYPKIHDKNSKIFKALYVAFVNHGYNKIDKYEFINYLNLKTCPYCNRNYIFTIDKNKRIKPEIDHFYPKSIYPYLAVSFYNLIPSCSICNGFGAKGNRDSFKDKLINPYEIKNNDFCFSFDIMSADILNNKLNEKAIKITFLKKIDSNNDYFQLENLYDKHRDIVIELYQKLKLEYSNEYLKILKKSFKLNFDEDEIYRLLYGYYKNENDFHKRPLSKMIKDIIDELSLIQK